MIRVLIVAYLAFAAGLRFVPRTPVRSALFAVPQAKSTWSSALSTSDNLDTAIDEALGAAVDGPGAGQPFNVALFFVSSIYEASAFQYQTIAKAIYDKLPSVSHVVGCTTGGVIGPMAAMQEPVEVEARASISVMLAQLDASQGISVDALHMTPEQVAEFTNQGSTKTLAQCSTGLTEGGSGSGSGRGEGKVLFLMATDGLKPRLSDLVSSLDSREGISAFGAVASSVTSLHTPKVFVSSRGESLKRLTAGVVGLYLRGDVAVETVVAHSCVAIGPGFTVAKADGREILLLQEVGQGAVASEEPQPPLVQLDRVLGVLPPAQADALKRELLVGFVPRESQSQSQNNREESPRERLFGQKPTAFDPFTGSLTVPCLPPQPDAATTAPTVQLQFCMRDSQAARLDLARAGTQLLDVLSQGSGSIQPQGRPLALLLLGSMERGNKVFRFSSWESKQAFNQLALAGLETSVPMAGMYSAGTFGRADSGVGSGSGSGSGGAASSGLLSALMETDSVYAVITTGRNKGVSATNRDSNSNSKGQVGEELARINADRCTASELARYSDRSDLVLVTKRDPESASPVKVASMDYVIPEKAPQPSNVLESMVWEREREVDRMRERFTLTRALSLAKAAEGKFPRRDAFSLLRGGRGAGAVKPLVVEFVRESLFSGKLDASSVFSLDAAKEQVRLFATELQQAQAQAQAQAAAVLPPIAALGCQTDFSSFRGSYEDLEALRSTPLSTGDTQAPIISSDFIVYGYQLFRAKSSGADAVKLMASVLSLQDLSYLTKIAASLKLQTIIQVYSKPQLLAVLDPANGLQASLECIALSGRNMRLWKLDPSKLVDLLSDPDCKQALGAFRAKGGVVLAEGVASESVAAVMASEEVDALGVGEELLAYMDESDAAREGARHAAALFRYLGV